MADGELKNEREQMTPGQKRILGEDVTGGTCLISAEGKIIYGQDVYERMIRDKAARDKMLDEEQKV